MPASGEMLVSPALADALRGRYPVAVLPADGKAGRVAVLVPRVVHAQRPEDLVL